MLIFRYKSITNEVKLYLQGYYGRAPGEINEAVRTKAIGSQKPIDCRPADLLEPELDKARESVKDFTQDIGDVLTAAIYPITGLRFLKWKYGLETPPPEVKPKTLDDVKREDEYRLLAMLGFDGSELRRMGFGQALVLAGLVMLLALPLGAAVAWILCSVLNPRAFGWSVAFHWSAVPVVSAVVAGMAAAVAAGLLGRRGQW